MLECCLNDDRDLVSEIVACDVKEEVRHDSIGISGELVVLDAKGGDIPLFDFIATNDWYPNCCANFLASLVLPDPGRPVTMMHLGLLFIWLNVQAKSRWNTIVIRCSASKIYSILLTNAIGLLEQSYTFARSG
jgi:hypothetical protein